MKKASILVLALVLLAGVGVALASSQKGTQTVEGTLVDSKCYLKMGAKTNDHGSMPGCGTACAKGGNPVGVLTADGHYYTLGVAAPTVAEHVGHTVRATGTVKEGVILPDKLEVKKGDKWEEIKLGPMA